MGRRLRRPVRRATGSPVLGVTGAMAGQNAEIRTARSTADDLRRVRSALRVEDDPARVATRYAARVTDRLVLSAPGCEASIAPGAGGRIAALRVDGLDLLVTERTGPIAWGAFPMVPWAGRLRDGILAFDGATHALPRTMPPHAIHGTLVEAPWDVIEGGPTSAVLAAPLGPPWPFGGRAVHRVALGPDDLVTTLEVQAADRAFPAIVGWHPWFPRRLARGGEATLDLRAGSMLARGDDYLPSGARVVPPPGPWDDCFVDVAAPPTITWPGAIRLAISSDAEYWVVFTMPADAFCVEPQTGPPNGLNTGPFVIVEPGRPLVATMTIRWERLRPIG